MVITFALLYHYILHTLNIIFRNYFLNFHSEQLFSPCDPDWTETFYIQVYNIPKVKVAVQFAATKIIYTPQKDQDEMLLSSFLYSSITISGNISDKPKK